MADGRLEHQIAIVTGGARGIGKATVLKLLGEGAAVTIADVLPKELAAMNREFEKYNDRLIFCNVDVSDREQVNNMVAQTIKKFNDIHILVNNAGIVRPSAVEEVSSDDWDAVVSVNLKGSFNCTQAVLPYFKKNKRGKIVNIGSRAALGKVDRAVYSSTKAGLIGLTRTLAMELAEYNVNVNCVSPGGIETELFKSVNPADSARTKYLIDSIPLKRMGKPEDIADLIAFLSTEESSFITGQNIFICGGLSIGSY